MRNPFIDKTAPKPLSDGEREILRRLEMGEKLYLFRYYNYTYEGSQNEAGEAIYSWAFFWDYNDHPYDHLVWLLIMRGLILPVTCGGGAMWFVRTEERYDSLAAGNPTDTP